MQFHLVIGTQNCLYFPIETIVRHAVAGGVTHVQLREKSASTDDFLAIAKRLQPFLKVRGIPFLINDRVDIALALNADGVHLGQTDMPYLAARQLLGPSKIIGLTINHAAQIAAANTLDLQYVGVGPVFATRTKKDAGEPLGLAALQKITAMSQHPVIAIGGIDVGNARSVMETGVAGIAVVSAITQSDDPKLVAELLKAL